MLGQPRAQTESGIADLTQQVGLAGDHPHPLFFAKAHFPETLVDVGRCRELFHHYAGARQDTVQWAQCRNPAGLGLAHGNGTRGTHSGITLGNHRPRGKMQRCRDLAILCCGLVQG